MGISINKQRSFQPTQMLLFEHLNFPLVIKHDNGESATNEVSMRKSLRGGIFHCKCWITRWWPRLEVADNLWDSESAGAKIWAAWAQRWHFVEFGLENTILSIEDGNRKKHQSVEHVYVRNGDSSPGLAVQAWIQFLRQLWRPAAWRRNLKYSHLCSHTFCLNLKHQSDAKTLWKVRWIVLNE
jgi:hypothetical protein